MSVLKSCPYCGGHGYINQFEDIEGGCRAWANECIACKGTGSILYPETNGDKVRRMSDEELAKLLLDGCQGSRCIEQPQNEYGSVNCFECRMKWLRQPVEEDT